MTPDTAVERAEGARGHLQGIESLRAYAASAIVIFHITRLTDTVTPPVLAFAKNFFGFGVPLFFVVSAFALAYGFSGRLSSREEIGEFYLRRLARIAPLFYVAGVFQYLANYPLFWIFDHPLQAVLNVTFLFNLTPATVNPVPLAGWSVGVEMLFYAIFPFVLALAASPWRAFAVTAVAVVMSATFTQALAERPDLGEFVAHGLVFNLPFFGFGLLAYQLHRALPAAGGASAPVAGLAGLLLLYFAAVPLEPVIGAGAGAALYQAAWGIPFGLLCIGMAQAPPMVLSNAATRFLGKISFGLYLAHPHVLAVLDKRHVYARLRELPGGELAHFAAAVLVTAVALIPVAWLLYVVIEEPGIRIGRGLAARARTWGATKNTPGHEAEGVS